MSDISIYDELSLLYIKQKDIKDLTPEEFYKLFAETKAQIVKYAKQNAKSDWMY